MSDKNSVVNKAKLYRLQKWQEDKSLTGEEYAKSLISKICSTYGFDEGIRDKMVDFYGVVRSNDLLRGRSVEVGVATSCFIVCRCEHLAYNVDDMISVVHINKKDVYSMYRSVKKGLELSVPSVSVYDYLVRFGGELEVGDDVVGLAKSYLGVVVDKGLVGGKNPLGWVAGSLYLGCKELGVGITQREIVDVVGVSEVVLRRRVGELREIVL